MNRKLWEMYENMNEVMYVSDIESYEVIYMNKRAREVIGIGSLEEIKGKKCYEVLQQSSKKCAICNNEKLKSGYFYEWKYYNPIRERTYMIKDTLIEDEGRQYRMELAFDLSAAEQYKTGHDYDIIINEALKLSLSSSSPDKSVEILMEYVCMALDCKRIYILEERAGEYFENTYRWFAKDVTTSIEQLPDVSKVSLQPWLDTFKDDESIIIKDTEELKESYPFMYDSLIKRGVRSAIITPLYYNDKLIGMFGVDNLPESSLNGVATMFMIMGRFIVALLRRRDLFTRLQQMSFYDELTGLGNRYAMDDYLTGVAVDRSLGIVNCDVMGLKKINDKFGHQAGDELLVKCAECLKRVFEEYGTFRTGGDEFLVVCKSISEQELYRRVERLDALAEVWGCRMAIGYIWRADSSENVHKLLAEADEQMYEDKRRRYKKGLFKVLKYS